MNKRRWLQKNSTSTASISKALVYIFIVLCWNYVLLTALLRDGVVYTELDTGGWKQPYQNATYARFTRRLHEKYHRAQYKYFYTGRPTCPLPCEEKGRGQSYQSDKAKTLINDKIIGILENSEIGPIHALDYDHVA